MAARKQPMPGDLIVIPNEGYGHWAVYVGDGDVIHLVPLSGTCSSSSGLSSGLFGEAKVKKEKLCEVAKGKVYDINNYLDKKHDPKSPEEIVKEAKKLEGETQPFNLLRQNCEHFATKLRYGIAVSKQVRDTALFLVFGWPLNKVADHLIPG